MSAFALDSDIVSYLLKKDKAVLSRLKEEMDRGREFILPPVVYYEVKRGLLSANATERLRLFSELCQDLTIGVMEMAAWDEAAKLYARQRQRGRLAGDADLLIAAFCLTGNYKLVTNNIRHFETIAGLVCVNWKN